MHDQQLASKYGHFSADGRAYVITRPDTPRPWCNILASENYGTVVSQAGGGFSWVNHSTLSVLTRWEMDLVRDAWGKWLYLRDEQSGQLWSAAPQPVMHPEACEYRCTHAIGSTVFEQTCAGIRTHWTLTVPQCTEPGQPAPTFELWRLRVTNTGQTRRSLSVCSCMMWCLGAAPDTKREFHRLFIDNRWQHDKAMITATKNLWEVPDQKMGHWNTPWPLTAFHAAWMGDGSVPERVDAVGDHALFTGRNGRWDAPAWLSDPARKGGGFGRHGDAMAAIDVRLELEAGEEKEILFALGAGEDEAQIEAMLAPVRRPGAMDRVLAKVAHFWEGHLGAVKVQTPDPAFDLLSNTWLPYQTLSSRLWGRTGFWQQSGAFGFRDQLQDSQIFLPYRPGRTLAQIRLHARHQFADGTVYHWWHPLSEVGLRTQMTDDLLWLPFLITRYLEETGQFDCLQECEPFVDEAESVSLWEHGRRAIERVLDRFSPRGLPLIGEGDWNDGLSACGRQGQGESIWLGHFLYMVLRDWAALARRLDMSEQAKTWETRARALREAINTHGWDGQWYLRATMDDGTPLGSAQSEEGKIFLNAQTWAVIAGTASPERAEQAMDSVQKYLHRAYGPILFWPAYSQPDARVGYLTRYAPGTRENGGLYTHAGTWGIQAACMMGRRELAWEMFERLAPPNRGLEPDLYTVEPYVTPGNVNGPDSPNFGEGGWSWYTGSAAWLRTIALEWILGVRASLEGLVISPCLPAHWEQASVVRLFRGDTFEISIRQSPAGLDGPALQITVDGEPHAAGEPITASGRGQVRRVEVLWNAAGSPREELAAAVQDKSE